MLETIKQFAQQLSPYQQILVWEHYDNEFNSEIAKEIESLKEWCDYNHAHTIPFNRIQVKSIDSLDNVEALENANIFYTANGFKTAFSHKEKYLITINTIFFDYDLKDFPDISKDELRDIIKKGFLGDKMPIKPSYIAESGHGFHVVYNLFPESLDYGTVFNDLRMYGEMFYMHPEDFNRVVKILLKLLKYKMSQIVGVDYDRNTDKLTQQIRVPGTFNNKHGGKKVLSQIIYTGNSKASLESLLIAHNISIQEVVIMPSYFDYISSSAKQKAKIDAEKETFEKRCQRHQAQRNQQKTNKKPPTKTNKIKKPTCDTIDSLYEFIIKNRTIKPFLDNDNKVALLRIYNMLLKLLSIRSDWIGYRDIYIFIMFNLAYTLFTYDECINKTLCLVEKLDYTEKEVVDCVFNFVPESGFYKFKFETIKELLNISDEEMIQISKNEKKKYDDNMDRLIVKLFLEGLSYRSISKETGFSIGKIQKTIKRNNVVPGMKYDDVIFVSKYANGNYEHQIDNIRKAVRTESPSA